MEYMKLSFKGKQKKLFYSLVLKKEKEKEKTWIFKNYVLLFVLSFLIFCHIYRIGLWIFKNHVEMQPLEIYLFIYFKF